MKLLSKLKSIIFNILFPYPRGKKLYFSSKIRAHINRVKILWFKILNSYLNGHQIRIHGVPEIIWPERLTIGDNISLNGNVFLHCEGGITIGNNVTLSHGCTVLSVGYIPDQLCKNPIRKEHEYKPVIIKDNVWLGANAMVMPGVTIDRNIIVAAGAVVTRDLDLSGWLYAGVPAKPIHKIEE